MVHALLATAALAQAAPPAEASPAVELIGVASLAGDDRDRSKLRTFMGKIPQSRLGSFGSGIDYTGADDLYIACDDRGPGDGAYDFRPRVQRLRIRIDPAAAEDRRVEVELVGTTLLTDESGGALTGFVGGFDPACPSSDWTRIDPEGVRWVRNTVAAGAPPGSFFISEEYGPAVALFGPDGRRLRTLDVPAAFAIAHPHRDPELELPPANRRGRQSNRGFEGLAISPDGSRLWAILQSPLIQDGGVDEDLNRVGRNIRVLELPVSTAAAAPGRQLVYPLNTSRDGVSEILAVDDERFLVLERDGKGGVEARRRALFLADAHGASNVSGVDALPARGLPAAVTPMTKTLFLDFMDQRFGLTEPHRGGMPEKLEGLCFGPDLPDGRRTLIVTSDNDLKADVPTWFWVFAVPPSALK